MSKFGKELTQALGEALAYVQGDPGATTTHSVLVPDEVDVLAIRKKLGLSREKFAARFGLDERAVQEWEQKRRRPDRSARAYLTVIARNPEAVAQALSAA